MNPARLVFAVLGWLAVALAVAGVFIPGLPTTVFVLAASYFFSKSSLRFSKWLCTHPWFAPTIERFAAEGGMSPSEKRRALAAMWIAIVISSAVLAGSHPKGALVTVAAGAVGTASILFAVRTAPKRASAH